MTAQSKFVIALVASAVVAGWGAYEILASLFDPIIRSLGT